MIYYSLPAPTSGRATIYGFKGISLYPLALAKCYIAQPPAVTRRRRPRMRGRGGSEDRTHVSPTPSSHAHVIHPRTVPLALPAAAMIIPTYVLYSDSLPRVTRRAPQGSHPPQPAGRTRISHSFCVLDNNLEQLSFLSCEQKLELL